MEHRIITAIIAAIGFALTAFICYRQGVMDGKESIMESFERLAKVISEEDEDE